jgi:hypothetical protein
MKFRAAVSVLIVFVPVCFCMACGGESSLGLRDANGGTSGGGSAGSVGSKGGSAGSDGGAPSSGGAATAGAGGTPSGGGGAGTAGSSANSCAVDADCVLYRDYCTACDCVVSSAKPPQMRPGDECATSSMVSCLVDACLGKTAKCNANQCAIE